MRRTSLVYLLTFSLALNGAAAATIALAWWKGQAQAREISLAQKPVANFLREDLDLTAEQSSPVVQQISAGEDQFVRLKNLMDSNRSELMRLITATPTNRTAVEDKVNEINRIQAELRLLAVGTVVRIVESLPPQARIKFGAYLQERGRICDGCGPGTAKGPFGSH